MRLESGSGSGFFSGPSDPDLVFSRGSDTDKKIGSGSGFFFHRCDPESVFFLEGRSVSGVSFKIGSGSGFLFKYRIWISFFLEGRIRIRFFLEVRIRIWSSFRWSDRIWFSYRRLDPVPVFVSRWSDLGKNHQDPNPGYIENCSPVMDTLQISCTQFPRLRPCH